MAQQQAQAPSRDAIVKALKGQGRSKYRAQATVVDGIRFDSKKEARRYAELKMLEKAGHIRKLILQPRFVLYVRDPNKPESEAIGAYRGDFGYEQRVDELQRPSLRWREAWVLVVEDVKGFKTPLYRWKKKHVEIQYGIRILET